MKNPARLFIAALAAVAFLLLAATPASALALEEAAADPAPVFEIPAIPAGIGLLVSFFSPLAIGVVNQGFWPAKWKKAIAVAVTLLLTAVAIFIYYSATGEPLPAWWLILIVGVAVAQGSYHLVLKSIATRIEQLTTSERPSGS